MPVWHLTLDLSLPVQRWRDGEITIPELAKQVTEKIKKSRWKNITGNEAELDAALDELLTSNSSNDYEFHFAHLYDLADQDRVWIETAR